jgi:hypothetical protein
MTTLEIKSDIHKSALLDVRDDMDVLNEQQKHNLQKSMQQANTGNFQSYQSLKQKHNQWFMS